MEVKRWISDTVKDILLTAGMTYNGMTKRRKRILVLGFGLATGALCILLIIHSLYYGGGGILSIDAISFPKDIHMNESTIEHQDELLPVGKFKVEIDGQFDAFYLAVDKEGTLYLNRELEYSRDAYRKENGWQPVSRQELQEYEKHLHFMPYRGPGIRP